MWHPYPQEQPPESSGSYLIAYQREDIHGGLGFGFHLGRGEPVVSVAAWWKTEEGEAHWEPEDRDFGNIAEFVYAWRELPHPPDPEHPEQWADE